MTAWLKRQAQVVVVGTGVGAMLFMLFRLVGFQPEMWSYFWGIFAGSMIRDLVWEWTRR